MSYSSDLRAPSMPSKRSRTRSEKYYGFRHIKPGQLGHPHYRFISSPGKFPAFSYDAPISEATPIEVWNKQRLFYEAQQWPRPPKYHHAHQDKLHKTGMTPAFGRSRYQAGELKRVLQGLGGLDDLTDDYEKGKRHFQNARGCAWCDAGLDWENERENMYEAEAEEEERELREQLLEHEEMAIGALTAAAEMADMRLDVVQLEEHGWTTRICGPKSSSSSEDEWEFEII